MLLTLYKPWSYISSFTVYMFYIIFCHAVLKNEIPFFYKTIIFFFFFFSLFFLRLFSSIFRWKVSSLQNSHILLMRLTWLTWSTWKNKCVLTKFGKLAVQFRYFLYTLFKRNQVKLLQSEILQEACREPIWNNLSLCVFFQLVLVVLLLLGTFSALVFLWRLFLWKITVIQTIPTSSNKNYWQVLFV